MNVHRYGFLLLSFFLLSCSGSKQDDGSGLIEGKIYMTGNEPFTHLAVEREDGQVFILSGPEELMKELQELQGKTVKLQCSKIVRGKMENTAVVEGVERVEVEIETNK